MISSADQILTKWIYNNIGLNSSPLISKAPYYLGLLPYELYVLPGMFVAVITMFYNQSFHPVQFHLLPHWFAFSVGLYLKTHLSRMRPGCSDKLNMNRLLDPGHCQGKTKFQSFPSGHTMIAFALATSLMLYLQDDSYDESEKKFIGIDFAQPVVKKITISIAYFVAFFISVHRISYGYHHVGDVIAGAILGSMIGYTSHTISNTARDIYVSKESEKIIWNIIRVIGSSLAVLGLVYFFTHEFKRLSALQH